ncbi:MAG TPA: ROK family protein [Dehalococcoidia bacterium]|nr:ROK family protein [Dehalococcoidia bacterium]
MSDHVYAGIDLGGTKILVLLATEDGRIIGDARLATHAAEGPGPVIARIVAAVREAADEAGIGMDDVRGAGVSAPGPIDRDEGVITQPPNLPGWDHVELAKIIRSELGVRAWLENDANCQAIAEHRYGAGRGYRDMIFLTVSTGIGGGIIIDNRLYVGASGAAGELGHLIVSPEGPACGAGHIGCLEAYASGTAIARRAAELVRAGRLPRTARLAEQTPPLAAHHVHMAADQGETEALEIIHAAGRYLGLGLATLIHAFNPQAIVLGGGLINIGEDLLGPARETARQRTFVQSWDDAQIIEGELGERSAALGAIAVAHARLAGEEA